MMSKSKRPVSVWIAQIILGLYGVGITLIVFSGMYRGLTDGIPNPSLYFVTTIGILTFAALFFGAFWGMAIRRSWGRWLGVAALSVLLIAAGITQTSKLLVESGPGIVSISFLLAVAVVAGLAFLIYLIAVGSASDAFFIGKSIADSEVIQEDSGNS